MGILIILVALLIAGCAQNTAKKRPTALPTTPPTMAPTATPALPLFLPAFSDWRVAYQAPDGSLHAVSLDGKTDVAGPLLPGEGFNGLSFPSAGVSPDGQFLAYDGDGGLEVLALTQHAKGTANDHLGAQEMAWSLDGRQLVVGDGEGSLSVVDPTNGQPKPIAKPSGVTLGHLIGWIDNAHLAVEIVNSATAWTFGSLNVSTGGLRTIATVRSAGLGSPRYSLSPDGSTLLFSNAVYRDTAYTPMADMIDTATGAIIPLSQIARINKNSGFTSVAWYPGSHNKVAVSTGFTANGDLKSWVLNLRNDTATHVLDGQYVGGWAPNNGPLILTVSSQMPAIQIQIGGGPYTLTAATISLNGQVSTTVLTNQAMTFPFIGFVRTA